MVVVCARSAGWPWPDAGARDQYIPEAGAGGRSGAELGEARGGKAVYSGEGARLDEGLAELRCWAVAGRLLLLATPLTLVVGVVEALTVRSPAVLLLVDTVVEPVAGADEGLLAIADVERSAAGLRPSLSVPKEDEGRWRSPPPGSPFSLAMVMMLLGFLMLTGGPVGDCARDEERAKGAGVTAEAALWRMESSDVEGFRLEVELLEAR